MMERDSLTPKQVETVEIILDNCRHLVRLLNDLLDLARSDAGRLADHAAADRSWRRWSTTRCGRCGRRPRARTRP